MDFLKAMLAGPLDNGKYIPKSISKLKIKTSAEDIKKLNKICKKYSNQDLLNKYFNFENFFSIKAGKEVETLKSINSSCNKTLLYDLAASPVEKKLLELIPDKVSLKDLKELFPETYEDKIADIMKKAPISKVKQLLEGYDFTKFNFTKEFSNYLSADSSDQSKENREFIVKKFSSAIIDRARSGSLSTEDIKLFSQKGDLLLKVNGDSALSAIRKNPQSAPFFTAIKDSIGEKAIQAIDSKNLNDPYLIEYMNNVNPEVTLRNGESFFKYVRKNSDADFKKQVLSKYQVEISAESEQLDVLNSLLLKTKDLSDEEVKKLSHDMCIVVNKINSQISCDSFEAKIVSLVKKYGLNVGAIVPLLNLIDQSSLYGQSTITYLLNSLIERANPELANYIASKKNFNSKIDPLLFSKMAPYIMEKVVSGEIEYNSERYRLREFINQAFKSSLTTKTPPAGLGIVSPSPEKTSYLFATNSAGEPVFMRDEIFSSSGGLILKSGTKEKIVEQVKCNDFSECISVGYKLSDFMIDVAASVASGQTASVALKGIKFITTTPEVRSIITSSNINSCMATCGVFLMSDLALGQTASVISLISIGGVATKVAQIAKLSKGVITGVNVFESIENFLVETQDDVIRAHECSTDCIVADSFRKVADKEKLIRDRLAAKSYIDSIVKNISNTSTAFDTVKKYVGIYAGDIEMQRLINNFEREKQEFIRTNVGGFINSLNNRAQIIAESNNSTQISQEQINISNEYNNLLNAFVKLGNGYGEKFAQLAKELREGDLASRDHTGVGGHGQKPFQSAKVDTPANQNTGVNNQNNNSGSSSSGGSIVAPVIISIPTW